jgi:hypothetical protein
VRAQRLAQDGIPDPAGTGPVASPVQATPPTPGPESPSSRLHPRQPARPQPPAQAPETPTSMPAAAGPHSRELRSTAAVDAAIEDLAAAGDSRIRPSRASSGWWDEVVAAGQGQGRLRRPIATAAAVTSLAAAAWAVRGARNRRKQTRGQPRPLMSAH